jgi:CheY-like chemotaxis protein
MSRICLIAEADLFIANLIVRFAEESGLACITARTGEELLALIPELTPRLLIVDPELPGAVRGWEAAQTLDEMGLWQKSAIISCSWLGRVEAHHLLGHADAHLQKPELHYADFVEALAVAAAMDEEPA